MLTQSSSREPTLEIEPPKTPAMSCEDSRAHARDLVLVVGVFSVLHFAYSVSSRSGKVRASALTGELALLWQRPCFGVERADGQSAALAMDTSRGGQDCADPASSILVTASGRLEVGVRRYQRRRDALQRLGWWPDVPNGAALVTGERSTRRERPCLRSR